MVLEKVKAALPTVTENVKNGKYATIQDVQKAVVEAMGPPPAPPGAPAPAPAPQ